MNGPVAGVILGNDSDFVNAILQNKNGSCVVVILENESNSYVGGILGNGLGVGLSQIGWIPLHNDPLHYHPSFLGYLGPLSGAYLSPPIPNPSLVYVTAPPPGLFPRTVHALWHLISFGVSNMTLLREQIVPPLAHAPYLRVFFAFVSAMWIPEKT